MVGEIAGVIGSLKGLKDLWDTTVSLHDAAAFEAKAEEFRAKLFDAREAALAAQEERSALLQRVRELEEEMTRMKKWEAEKERYELVELSPGVLARALKETACGSEAPHLICADCYEAGKKRHLQSNGRSDGIERLKCHDCKSELIVRYGGDHRPRVVRSPPSWNDFRR